MKELNDYFRFKEFERAESEKKCMIAVKRVIDICLKKNYIFNVHSNDGNNNISVTTDGWTTSFVSYFKGDLINYSDETGTVTIFELLEKLKKL